MLRFVHFALLAASLEIGAPSFAATYQVTGVEWGDVLYIRASASPKAAIVGAIPYNGQDIDVIGTPSRALWTQVTYRDLKGFVAAKHLKAMAAFTGLPKSLECHGTEPFWTIKIDPKGSTYQSMDETKEPLALDEIQSAANNDSAWFATGGTPKAPVAVAITRGEACSEGMSDDVFPYSILAKIPNGGVVSGCCQ